jgi:uncharacterized protein
MAKKMKWFDWIAFILVVVGGLAWGIYGVTSFFGNGFLLINWIVKLPWIANIVYTLVGLMGLLGVYTGIKLATK